MSDERVPPEEVEPPAPPARLEPPPAAAGADASWEPHGASPASGATAIPSTSSSFVPSPSSVVPSPSSVADPPTAEGAGVTAAADDPFGSRSVAIYFKDTLSLERPVELSAPEPEPSPDTPLLLSGSRYTFVSELGRGGFATVYLVQDEQLHRPVALKLLRLAGKGPQAVLRFIEEARATAGLEHPNIVPVYDVGALRGIPYYTMKLVRGRSFASILHALRTGDAVTTREWTLTRLVQVLLQVTMAAHYAHEKGFVHRDLKPGNVMLGTHGEVFVMDWGLSYAISRAQTRRGLLGTPVYMAPEQATGRLDEVGPRTDVYALGVMLYEALTYRRPFEGREIHALLREIAVVPPPHPAVLARPRPVPEVLAAIALRSLAKVALIRHPSARSFHDDLQGWLEMEGEKRLRGELSLSRLPEAASRLEVYRRLRSEVRAAEEDVASLRARFKGPEPLAEKTPLFAAEERLRVRRRELVRGSSGAMSALTEALAFDPANAEARRRIAEYYLARLEEAEERGDGEGREFFAELLAKYDDGTHRDRLADEARLAVHTEPAGLEVAVERLGECGPVVGPVETRELGPSPVADDVVRSGSHVVRVTTPAGVVRAPVVLPRGARRVLAVRGDLAPPPGLVLIPAGPFRSGPPPGRLAVLGDFAIAVHPVTLGEYVEFLEQLVERAPDEARARLPRVSPDVEPFVRLDAGGRLQLDKDSPYGLPWSMDWPAMGITWHDAVAYARFRGDRLGVALDLPTSLEWEKAARGVDGRRFPWGDRFDPALANMKRTHAAPHPVAVDELPTDVSPYGVRGLGGNVRDWCADVAEDGDESRDERALRGGAWSLGAGCVETWAAGGLAAAARSSHVGFRLVWRPPEEHADEHGEAGDRTEAE